MRRLAQFDLNLLEIFEAIYAEGGVSRAARHLNLSQPAVSHSLARLRDAFGDELFVREGNRLVPTAMAREIIGPVREALRNFGFVLTSAMTFDPAKSDRLFRMGMRLSSEVPNLAALAGAVHEHGPNIRLTSAHFSREDLVELLANGELDVAFDVYHSERNGLHRKLVREDDFVVAARKDHPLVQGQLSLETYLKLDHVFASPRSVGLGHEDNALRKLGLERRIAVRCQNAMTAWRVMAQSDMLLTLSRRYAEMLQALDDNQLMAVPLELPPAQMFMYWHEASERDPGGVWLRDILAKTLQYGE